ncbi:MAG: Lrp/AsnC family transcriptional regulator [Thermoprotei archaeon]|nr:MAG: AsnC family transcriptional regulator [Thermofilum sp. ex4484_79]RLE61785.1 MAG: Lrp/AsnC family transcriptional regulator [Thermoprotei archaeon]
MHTGKTVAFIMINTEIGAEEEILNKLREFENVNEAYIVYGIYDLVVKVEVENQDELRSVIMKIRKLERVRSTLTILTMEGFQK